MHECSHEKIDACSIDVRDLTNEHDLCIERKAKALADACSVLIGGITMMKGVPAAIMVLGQCCSLIAGGFHAAAVEREEDGHE